MNEHFLKIVARIGELERRLRALESQASVDGFGCVARLATIEDIDVTATGATSLLAVPAGRGLVVEHVILRATDFVSGGKTVDAEVSFGGNGASYDDYLGVVGYAVSAQDVFLRAGTDGLERPIYAAGTEFSLRVDTASDAGTEVWAVDVFGYWVGS